MHLLPITVIIPTMNRPESLDRTIKLIIGGSSVPDEIIIVDQSQIENTRLSNKEIITRYSQIIPSTVYIHQEVPSLTQARNQGVANAKNDILVFADDDIDVNADTLTNVVALMSDENIAMIGGIDELTQHSSTNIGYLLGTKSFRKRKIGHVTSSMLGRYPDNITTQIETEWAMGYFFVVRKSLLNLWHIQWDENLTSYAYAEDLDFSYTYYKNAKLAGLKCILDPSVKVKHLATLEYRIPSVKSLYMYIINREYLGHKHQMGISGQISRLWCNLNRLIQQCIKQNKAKTIIHAMWCTMRYRKEINSGQINYDKYICTK